jgi:hypothetical protein
LGGSDLLTEQEVSKRWRQLFTSGVEMTPQVLQRAEQLLAALRPESPLRYRLASELEELQRLHQVPSAGS